MIDSRLHEQIVRLIVAANKVTLDYLKNRNQTYHDKTMHNITVKYQDFIQANKDFLDKVDERFLFLDDYESEDLQFILALMYFGREYGTSVGKDVKEMTQKFKKDFPVDEYRWEKNIIINQMMGKLPLSAYLEYGLLLLGY